MIQFCYISEKVTFRWLSPFLFACKNDYCSGCFFIALADLPRLYVKGFDCALRLNNPT
nr:MAG TPA: hypothetical protein [Caudoviricetes sp.]